MRRGLALLLLTVATGGCAGKSASCEATFANARFDGDPSRFLASGGLIRFTARTNAEKMQFHCSAYLEPQPGNPLRVRAYTVKHCMGALRENVEGVEVEARLGGQMFRGVVAEEYTRRHNALSQGLRDLGAQGLLASVFLAQDVLWDPGRIDNATMETFACVNLTGSLDTSFRAPDLATHEKICAHIPDSGVFELEFPASEKQRLAPIVRQQNSAREKAKRLAGGSAGTAERFMDLLRLRESDRRLAGIRNFSRWYRGCRGPDAAKSQGSGQASSFCPRREELLALVKKVYLPDGMGIGEVTSGDLSPYLRAQFPRLGNEEFRMPKEALAATWRKLVPKDATALASLHVLTNLHQEKQGGVVTNFVSLPFRAIVNGSSRIVVRSRDDGFEMYVPRKDLKVSFQAGDSGTFFSLAGGFPLVGLSTVDDKETTAGSALRPLPEKDAPSDAPNAPAGPVPDADGAGGVSLPGQPGTGEGDARTLDPAAGPSCV